MAAKYQARSEGDDHHRDIVDPARPLAAVVEDKQGGEEEHANPECDTRLDQAHALLYGVRRAGVGT